MIRHRTSFVGFPGALPAAVALLSATLLVATAFAANGYAPQAWRGRVAMEDGVPTVINPLQPMLDTGTSVLVRRWTVPNADDRRTRAPWAEPRELTIGRNFAYVVDPKAHSVYQIDSSGSWVRTIGGKQGQGPGELDSPGFVAFNRSEVFIGTRGTIQVFRESDGAFQRAIRIPTPPLFSLTRETDSTFIASGYGGRQRMTVAGEFSTIPGQTPPPSRGQPGARAATPCARRNAPAPIVLSADCYLLRIDVLNSAGAANARYRIERDTVRFTRAQVDSVRAANYALVGGVDKVTPEIRRYIEADVDRASTRAVVTNVLHDGTTGVMVIVEESTTGQQTTFHFISAAGVYVARQRFAGRMAALTIANSRIVVLAVSNATGEVSAEAYDVRLPAAALQFKPPAAR